MRQPAGMPSRLGSYAIRFDQTATAGRPGLPLFVYGTLMFPGVVRAVLGRVPPSRQAHLAGYIALTVRGERFPGIIRDSNGLVEGRLIEDLNKSEWLRLDAYEDPFYTLATIEASVGAETVSALCYTVAESARGVLSHQRWSADRFALHLPDFLEQNFEDRNRTAV